MRTAYTTKVVDGLTKGYLQMCEDWRMENWVGDSNAYTRRTRGVSNPPGEYKEESSKQVKC